MSKVKKWPELSTVPGLVGGLLGATSILLVHPIASPWGIVAVGGGATVIGLFVARWVGWPKAFWCRIKGKKAYRRGKPIG